MGNPQKYFVKATYDFATDAGGTGARTLAITDNVPKGATITDVILEKVTNITASGNNCNNCRRRILYRCNTYY